MNTMNKEYRITINSKGQSRVFESEYAIDVQFIEELFNILDNDFDLDTFEKLYDIGSELIMKDSNATPLYNLALFLISLEKEKTLDSLYEEEGRYGLLDMFYNSIDF